MLARAMRYFVPDIRVAAELPPQRSLEDKLGGLPWGLEPSRWPRCADCGTSMSLLAQFAHNPERLDLGREGRSLLVFQCNHDPGMCQTWDGRSGANACFVLEAEAVVPRLAETPPDGPVIENEVRVVSWIARDDGIPSSMAARFFGVAEVPDEYGEMPTWSTRLGSVPRWIQSPLDAPEGWRFVGQLDSTYSFLAPPAAPPPWISPDQDQFEGRTHDAVGPNFGDGGIAYIFLRETRGTPEGFMLWQCG